MSQVSLELAAADLWFLCCLLLEVDLSVTAHLVVARLNSLLCLDESLSAPSQSHVAITKSLRSIGESTRSERTWSYWLTTVFFKVAGKSQAEHRESLGHTFLEAERTA